MSAASNRVPTVWHFLPCDRIDRWGHGAYSLTKVRLTIPNPFDRPAPRLFPELWLYIVATNATGPQEFQLQQTCLHDQTRVFYWTPFVIDFGDDPTAVHQVSRKLDDVVFWALGQCEFLLYCRGSQVASLVIDVR